MLLPDNMHPEYSIYYNGSIVLNILQDDPKYELLDLYQAVKSVSDMTFTVFILCLDWLYLIDVAKLTEGKVVLCS